MNASNKQSPKVTIIGAGSIFFGRQAIWQMCHSKHLQNGTLALVDTNKVNLARMTNLAKKVIADSGVSLKLESSTTASKVLPGSDFVILSFAYNSVKYRNIDCMISEKYNIRMCSGDTIGPGGIMRTLREFPHIHNYCKQISELCPDAFVINYINPTAANGIGIKHFWPKLKSFALCDGLHMPHVKKNYAVRAGIIRNKNEWNDDIDKRFDCTIAGVNHFTWLLKAEYDGKNIVTEIAEELKQRAATETDGGSKGAKAEKNNMITYELYKAFGYVPACTGHTKEYVPFYQGLGVDPSIFKLSLWDDDARYRWHAAMWEEVDGYNYDVTPIAEFSKKTGPDHATDIIEAMWSESKKPFYINTANGTAGTGDQKAVENMPEDAFLELLCDVSMKGVTPRHVGAAPVGLRGLWQQVLDTHELTARAAVHGDRDMLHTAFACDPLTLCLNDTKKLIEELLQAEKETLPEYWFNGK
jgi:alpha-galactosidase